MENLIIQPKIWSNKYFIIASGAFAALLFYFSFLSIGFHTITALLGYGIAAFFSFQILVKLDLKRLPQWCYPLMLLMQFVTITVAISAIIYLFQTAELGFKFRSLSEFLLSFHFAKFLFASLVTLIIALAIFLLINSSKAIPNAYVQSALLASIIITVLYIYGEYDRFLVTDNPIEDLSDFGFFFLLVLIMWSLALGVTKILNERKQVNIKSQVSYRAIALLAVLIPIDILLNWLYLKLVYGFELYMDYWAIELPLKVLLVILLSRHSFTITSGSNQPASSGQIRVQSGKKVTMISIPDIAFCAIHQEVTYIATFDGHRYITEKPLHRLYASLGPGFFRASRQLVVARPAVKGYSVQSSKKLNLETIAIEGLPKSYQISRLSAPALKKWLRLL